MRLSIGRLLLLDRHLHRLYDPVGKYGEAAPLYGYLYVVGVIGLLCWWANLRRAVRGARGTRRLGVIYDDEYRCIAGAWKIVTTRSRILAVVSGRDETIS